MSSSFHPTPNVGSPSASVLVEAHASGAVQIWLNRPDAMNALSNEVSSAVTTIVADALSAGATALIVRAKGRGFCAGADLKERQGMTPEQRYASNRLLNGMINAVAAAPVPTLCAINGIAFGGGLELALGCDLRLAAESAKVGLTEARIGAIPGAGGTQRLPRVVGISRALEMIFTGEPVTARRAAEIGLVNACVPDDELDEAVGRYIDLLGSRSPSAACAAKRVIYKGMELSLADGLECEREELGSILGSADYAEGVAAFVEKRPPRFKR